MLQNTVSLFTGDDKKQFKFSALVLAVVTVFVVSRLFGDNYIRVIALVVFTFIIVEVYISIQEKFIGDFNLETMGKLKSLQELSDKYILSELSKGIQIKAGGIPKYSLDSMYMDANLIIFLYSIKDLYQYNPKQFFKILKGTNNILRLRRDMQERGVIDDALVKKSIDLQTNVLNNIHDYIYTVPKTEQMAKYIWDVTNNYKLLTDKTIDFIHYVYTESIDKKGINRDTVFISNPKHHLPKPYPDPSPFAKDRYYY